jgi:long-chain acyl-CoA synthetase
MHSGGSLHLGHAVVLMDKWDAEEMLRLIEKYRCTTSHMVPTQFHRLLLLPEAVRGRYDASSTRHMIHAAAPCPPDVKRRMIEWWGNSIYEYYAATEGGGTIVSPEEWMQRPGTVGKAWPTAEVRILDDEGAPQPAGQQGTIYMKLPDNMAFEYKGDAAKRRRHRLSRRRGLPVPVRSQDRHDHLRRREHLSRRDRERVSHAPEGGRRGGLRHPP